MTSQIIIFEDNPRLRSGYAQKSEKIIICAFWFEKNGRKSSFFRSGFHQIIIKSPQKKTAMTFETDAHLGAGV